MSLSLSLCSCDCRGVGTQSPAVQEGPAGVGWSHQMQHWQIRPSVHDVRVLLRTGWPRLAQRQGWLVNARHALHENDDAANPYCFVLEEVTPDKARTLDGDYAWSDMWLKKKVKGTSRLFSPPCKQIHFPLASHTIQSERAHLGMEWKVQGAGCKKRGRPNEADPKWHAHILIAASFAFPPGHMRANPSLRGDDC